MVKFLIKILKIFTFYRLGYVAGYKAGLEHDNAQNHDIKASLAAERDCVVAPIEFDIKKEFLESFEADIKRAGALMPTQDQMDIILNAGRNIYITAGAGSGKSTTLLRRIYFMYKYLKIPLEEITIFSFTRASTIEFRKNLISVFDEFGIPISEKQASNVVRTFHSKILEFSRYGRKTGYKIFEFIDGSELTELEEEKKALECNSKNRLNDFQMDILVKAYDSAYFNNNKFKSIIDSMYHKYIRGEYFVKRDIKAYDIKYNEKRDRDLDRIVRLIFGKMLSGYELVELGLSGEYAQYNLIAYKSSKFDSYLVLQPSKREIHEHLTEADIKLFKQKYKVNPEHAFSVKRSLAISFCNKSIWIVNNKSELRLIEGLLASDKVGHKGIPRFMYMLEGEFVPAPLVSSFYSVAIYIESMGLDVNDLIYHLDTAGLRPEDVEFVDALIEYWEELSKFLKKLKIVRFPELFKNFSENNSGNFSSVGRSVMDSMKHVVIDEFQDISPDVVQWIRGVSRFNCSESKLGSLICVGDEAQSIYSWKGSCPGFLRDYPDYFNSKNPIKLMLKHNFRSPESVIRISEAAIQGATDIDNKRVPCRTDEGQINEHVEIIMNENISEIISYIFDLITTMQETENILVLSRKRSKEFNEIKRQVKTELSKNDFEKIEFHSYHTSKGLEATYAVLIGDSGYSGNYPLKNHVVNLSMLKKKESFDNLQTNESRRLMYVALSRAKKKVTWFVEPLNLASVYNEIKQVDWKSSVKREGLGL